MSKRKIAASLGMSATAAGACRIPAAMATAGSASCTEPGKAGCRRPCGKTHVAGERMFVDYAGTNDQSDRCRHRRVLTQLFVAVLGACNYIHAEATWMQGLADWIGSHVPHLRLLRRGAGAGCPRQYQIGDHQGLLLRADGQPHLRGDDRPLRHRHRAGAPLQAA